MVKTYHPDRNRGSRLAEKKFQQINSAWGLLKDPNKRKLFDENLRKAENLKKELWTQEPAVLAQEEKNQAIDLEFLLKVSLEDLCQSKVKTIRYLKPVNGLQEKSHLKVQIPLGLKPGGRLLFKGKGGSEGKKNFGSLYVKVLITPHKIFKITDNSFDIVIEQPISFISAIQSQKVEILSPYGFLSLNVTPPIQDKQVLKVKDYGLRKNSKGERGDLFVKFFIEYPAEHGMKIQEQMLGMSYEEKKRYIEQFKKTGFIYPKVLKFQKKIQELQTKYYPNEKL